MIGTAPLACQSHEIPMVAPAPRLAPTLDAAPIAFLALVGGAMAMGISPVFVRFAEVGPFTSAFWRVGLALPALWLWSYLEGRGEPVRAKGSDRFAVLLAGLFFAGDLSFWHLAIMNTSVANATFLATLAPVWVVLGSGLFLGESVAARVFFGLALCLVGAAALIGDTWSINPGQLDGDIYGVATSLFFGLYFLAVRRARRAYGAGRILFLSTVITAIVLLVEALIIEDVLWPPTIYGVAALLAMALVSHSGGQGLLAFALGHLPAAFSSLVIFLEAVFAAFFAWLILSEPVGLIQLVGAVAIFAGITVARPRRAA
jgi:drug/metabolite transporter (DMT)-like permease